MKKRYLYVVRARVIWLLLRPLCLLRRHRYWNTETLGVVQTKRSWHCGYCNRLILKKEYRHQKNFFEEFRDSFRQ